MSVTAVMQTARATATKGEAGEIFLDQLSLRMRSLAVNILRTRQHTRPVGTLSTAWVACSKQKERADSMPVSFFFSFLIWYELYRINMTGCS